MLLEKKEKKLRVKVRSIILSSIPMHMQHFQWFFDIGETGSKVWLYKIQHNSSDSVLVNQDVKVMIVISTALNNENGS